MLKLTDLFLICFLLLSGLNSALAQPLGETDDTASDGVSMERILQKIRPHVDIGLRHVTATDSTFDELSRVDKARDGSVVLNLGLGLFVPVVDLQNKYAVGFQTGIGVGGTPFGNRLNLRRQNYVISVPLFISVKTGPTASKLSPKNQGIGLGLGTVWMRRNATGLGNGLSYRTNAFVPAAFVEATLGQKRLVKSFPKTILSLRLTAHLTEGGAAGFATPQGRSYRTEAATFGYYSFNFVLTL